MAAMIDTSFLLAAIFPNEKRHTLARQSIQSLKATDVVVVDAVLQELFYMTVVRVHYRAAYEYLERLYAASFNIQSLTTEDRQRMTEIMRQYESAAFDYTDAAIMVLSERLNIQQIYTFDHRDSSIFRPKHYAIWNYSPEPASF